MSDPQLKSKADTGTRHHPAQRPTHPADSLVQNPPACCRTTRTPPSTPCGRGTSCRTSPAARGRACAASVRRAGRQATDEPRAGTGHAHARRRAAGRESRAGRSCAAKACAQHVRIASTRLLRATRANCRHKTRLHILHVFVVQGDDAADEGILRAAAARLLGRLACSRGNAGEPGPGGSVRACDVAIRRGTRPQRQRLRTLLPAADAA